MKRTFEQKESVVYGGAFNPPTRAHEQILQACVEYADEMHGDVARALEVLGHGDLLHRCGLVGLEPLIEIDLDIFREYTVASVVQLTITGTWVLVCEYTITSINQQVAVTVFGGHWLFVVLIGHLVVFSNPHFQDMDA